MFLQFHRAVCGIISTGIVLMLANGTALAASPLKEFYVQQALERYFPLPQDAKNIGAAGSAALSCDDSACQYLNPAGLGGMKEIEFSVGIGSGRLTGEDVLTAESIEQVEHRGYLLLAIPLGPLHDNRPSYGTLSLGYSRYIGNTDDSINTTPDGFRRSIGYGYALSPEVNIGYAFHFYDDQLRSNLADLHSHSRILHVFGTQFEAAHEVLVGAQFRLGIGQSDTEDFALGSNGLSHLRQYTTEISLSKKIYGTRAFAAFDYTKIRSRGDLSETSPGVVIGGDEEGSVLNARFGAEVEPLERFTTRVGVRWYQVIDYAFKREDVDLLSGNISAPYFSSGLGYRFEIPVLPVQELVVNYGVEYTPLGKGDWKHLLTIAARFPT